MSQLYFAYFYTGQTRANHFFQLLAPEISIGYPEPESNFMFFFRFRVPGIEPESNRNFAKYPESNRNEKTGTETALNCNAGYTKVRLQSVEKYAMRDSIEGSRHVQTNHDRGPLVVTCSVAFTSFKTDRSAVSVE